MENELYSIIELDIIAQQAKSIRSRKPQPAFLMKRLPPIKLRVLTEALEQFDATLQRILRLPNAKAAFYELCDLYCKALPEQRKKLRRGWDFNRHWELPDQTTLTCHFEGEPPPEARIKASLIYASLMNAYDYRDLLMWLAPIYHSARLIGLDADIFFNEISDISSPVAASLIDNFVHRDPKLKSLSAWKLAEVETEQGTKLMQK